MKIKTDTTTNAVRFRAFTGQMARAYKEAGYRERYAMMNGKRKTVTMNGHRYFEFTYPDTVEYQDANGAAYDTVRGAWVC